MVVSDICKNPQVPFQKRSTFLLPETPTDRLSVGSPEGVWEESPPGTPSVTQNPDPRVLSPYRMEIDSHLPSLSVEGSLGITPLLRPHSHSTLTHRPGTPRGPRTCPSCPGDNPLRSCLRPMSSGQCPRVVFRLWGLGSSDKERGSVSGFPVDPPLPGNLGPFVSVPGSLSVPPPSPATEHGGPRCFVANGVLGQFRVPSTRLSRPRSAPFSHTPRGRRP